MNAELSRLIHDPGTRFYGARNGPESRFHLLTLPPGATSTPTESFLSDATQRISGTVSKHRHAVYSEAQGKTIIEQKSAVSPRRDSKISLTTSSIIKLPVISEADNQVPQFKSGSRSFQNASTQDRSPSAHPTKVIHALYNLADLPFTLDIDESTKSCTLSVDKYEYIFELEKVESGQLHISNDKSRKETKLKIEELSTKSDTVLRAEPDKQTLAFQIVDREGRELLLVIKWNKG